MVRVDNEPMTIAELINRATPEEKGCMYQKILMRYGIKAGVGCFYVKRTANKNFQTLFEKSKWKNNWHIALTRIKGSNNNNNKAMWINGKTVKVVKIPFERWV